MKNLLLAALLLIFGSGIAQNKYAKGFYLTFDEILNNRPSEQHEVELETRSLSEIKMNGGNDFQLNALDKTTDRGDLKKKFAAYSDGENLYLNCKKFKLHNWYAKVLSDKKYFVFTAGLPEYPSDFGIEITEVSSLYGSFGGAIGGGVASGIQGAKLATLRFAYLLDKSTQKVTLVSDRNIRQIIGKDAEMLERFTMDPDKSKLETVLRYLTEWNEKQ